MIPAKTVAEFVLWYSHDRGDPVSNLKLQKLLYYAQGWYLAQNDAPLFQERIEAWVHGPVVPPIYGDYKAWSWQPIMLEATKPELDAAIEKHLDEVMQVYGSLTAIHLERLTHSESPWLDARGDLAPDEPCAAVIPQEAMKAFFRSQLAEAD